MAPWDTLRKYAAAGFFLFTAACSSNGNASHIVPLSGDRAAARATTSSTLYVSDFGGSTVTLYPANVSNPTSIAMIADGISKPDGIWIDSKGVLYVANFEAPTGGFGSVTEYQPGAQQPFLIIPGLFRPRSVAVDSGGNVYVAGNTSGGTVWISEFAPGSTIALKTVFPTSDRGIPFMGGLATDPARNVYAAFFVYHHPPAHVVEFGPGLTNERDLHLAGLDTNDINAGLARDAQGNLYVGGGPRGLNVYAPGSTTPARTIQAGFSQYFAVSAAGALYVPNQSFVSEYAAGASTPFTSFKGVLQFPEGAAIGSAQ